MAQSGSRSASVNKTAALCGTISRTNLKSVNLGNWELLRYPESDSVAVRTKDDADSARDIAV
jgi:hypothetical protein